MAIAALANLLILSFSLHCATALPTEKAFEPPTPLSIARLPNVCPPPNAANQSIITTWDKSQFLCETDTNYISGDITGIIAYSVKDCADACATYTQFSGGCDSFTIGADLARSYEINNGANCWLKKQSDTDGKNYDYNGVSATLIRVAA